MTTKLILQNLSPVNTKPLPRKIQSVLDSMPSRGGGLNLWLFKAALNLRKHRSPEEIQTILEEKTAGEAIKHGEIERAVCRSGDAIEGKLLGSSGISRPWSSLNVQKRNMIFQDGANLEVLHKASPIPCSPGKPSTQQVISTLFPEDSLICCGVTLMSVSTQPIYELWDFLHLQQFIVPSPMKAKTGKTQDGRISQRCLRNTDLRRHLVIEQDSGTLDEQAAILLELARLWPMSLVVHSGGKSLHGWFYCEGKKEREQLRFMNYAVSLGADPATWTKCQLVRMPGGLRDSSILQKVEFFNPYVVK